MAIWLLQCWVHCYPIVNGFPCGETHDLSITFVWIWPSSLFSYIVSHNFSTIFCSLLVEEKFRTVRHSSPPLLFVFNLCFSSTGRLWLFIAVIRPDSGDACWGTKQRSLSLRVHWYLPSCLDVKDFKHCCRLSVPKKAGAGGILFSFCPQVPINTHKLSPVTYIDWG